MFSATLASLVPATLNILMVGNSHTSTNDVPSLLRNLLVSGGVVGKVTTKPYIGGLLNDQASDPNLIKEIQSKRWNVIILQGALVSSSHKYRYSQEGGIKLANLAKKSGAKTLLFAEWPRQGWDEAGYQMKVYEEIARPTGTVIVPIPWVFRKALQVEPKANFWTDGNHATLVGSYLAAATLYYWVTEQHRMDPTWAPKGMSKDTSDFLIRFAKEQHVLEYPD